MQAEKLFYRNDASEPFQQESFCVSNHAACRFAGKARCFRSLQGWRRCTAALRTFQSVRQRAPEYEQQAEGKEEKTGNGAEDNNEGRLKETQQGYAAAAGQAAFHGRKWKKERPAPGAGLSQT